MPGDPRQHCDIPSIPRPEPESSKACKGRHALLRQTALRNKAAHKSGGLIDETLKISLRIRQVHIETDRFSLSLFKFVFSGKPVSKFP